MNSNFRINSIILFFPLFAAFISCSQNKTAPVLPVEDFFRKPAKTSFQLSPDGNHISYLAPINGYMNLYLMNVVNNDSIRITGLNNGDIQKYFWKNNRTLVYLQTDDSDSQNLFSIDIKERTGKKLIALPGTDIQIIDKLKNNNDEILVALNKRDRKAFDIYTLNILSGSFKLVEENPGNITWWFTDNNGKIRLAVISDGINSGLLYRKIENEKFKPVLITNFKNFIEPVTFTPDNKNIYAITNIGRDKSALVEYDLENNKEVKTIFTHHEVDIDWAYTSDVTNNICGVSFTTWKREYKFFCSEWEKAYNKIAAKFPGRILSFVNADSKEEKILFKTSSDKTVGEYYYYNSRSGELKKLADIAPWVNEKDMASMKSISYKARDGLTIHGYLTIPKGKKAEKLPVVVFPHEGPWLRTRWEFNSEVQFLANRGYAVLQINYRGSQGYGKNFWQAGFKEWGKKMQDDVTDGVNWLINQNIADPKRIAIFGKSYGGYAALMGLALTPDLYACGIVFSGILNVADLVESIPPQYEPFRKMMYEMVGDPEQNNKELEQISPAFLIDKFKDPILIAHGGKDRRVKKYEVDKFVAALTTNGVPVKYYVKKNEGHSFKNEQNRFELYTEVERFLSETLKNRKK